MERHTFGEFLSDLCIFFERKPPSKETATQWHEIIQHIPSQYLRAISQELKRLDAWPRNLPAFMVRIHTTLAEKNGDNPQHQIHDRRFHPDRWANKECQKCHGAGLYKLTLDKWPTGPKTVDALCECTAKWETGG